MLSDLKRELEALAAASPLREVHPARGRRDGQIEFRGRVLADFTNWDYFNLSSNDRIKRIAHEELELSGLGSCSSRASSGSVPAHILCERRFASFFGTESALLFSSKTQAAFSLLTSVLGERDVVIAEEQMQLPAADAAFLVGASYGTFSHRSLGSLGAELERHRHARRKVVLVESLVSLTGDICPLAPIADTCAKMGASLWVDESAGIGALGPRGAGGSDREHVLVSGKITCKISELSCLLGSPGAVVCGPAVLIGYLLQRSRAIASELAASPLLSASASAAIDHIEISPGMRVSLAGLSQRFRSGIAALLHLQPELSESPVVSLPYSSGSRARDVAAGLFSRGVLVDVVQTRTLLSELSLVRFILSSAHTEAVIDSTLVALAEVLARVDTA